MDLGLSPAEFWEMTPRQFFYHVRRHEERIRSRWRHTASMMALYANCHRDVEARPTPFTSDDFMPRSEPTPPAKPGDLGPEVFGAFERAFAETHQHRP
jgi:hypothetical protein